MNQTALEAALAGLPLGGIKYFNQVGSTNDEAARWASQGAYDLSLVVAGEQTSGRGRAGRTWYTHPEAALAFSLVLFPPGEEGYVLPRLTALGALAVCDTLQTHYGLQSRIKWPNDVLVDRHKVAGVLAEAQWSGHKLEALILGIGLNVGAAALEGKQMSLRDMAFPATTIETALGRPVNREEMLYRILEKIIAWRKQIGSHAFLNAWESNLAFRGEWVSISQGESAGKDGLPYSLEQSPPPLEEGQIVGLAPDGSLKLRTRAGEAVSVRVGEVRLRAALPERR